METVSINVPVVSLISILTHSIGGPQQYYASMAYGDALLVTGRIDPNSGAVSFAIIRVKFGTGEFCVYQQGIDIRTHIAQTDTPSFLLRVSDSSFVYGINGKVFQFTVPAFFTAGAFYNINFTPITLRNLCGPYAFNGLYKIISGGYVGAFSANVPTPLDNYVTVYNDALSEIDHGMSGLFNEFYSAAALLDSFEFGHYGSQLFYNNSQICIANVSASKLTYNMGQYAAQIGPLNCASGSPNNKLYPLSVYSSPPITPQITGNNGGFVGVQNAMVLSESLNNGFIILGIDTIIKCTCSYAGGQVIAHNVVIKDTGEFLAFQWYGNYVKTFTGTIPQPIINKIQTPVINTPIVSQLLNWHRPISTRGLYKT